MSSRRRSEAGKSIMNFRACYRSGMEEGSPRKSLDDTLSRIAVRQENFIKSTCRHFCGFKVQLQAIENYIRQEDNVAPLIVAGEPGSGKSSLLSKAISNLRANQEFNRFRFFYHFVDGSESNSLEDLVLRLLSECELGSDDCKDLASVCYKCHNFLSDRSSRPTVVFVDAIHQLTTESEVSIHSWLPRKMGLNIRIVVSVTVETKEHELLIKERPYKVLTVPHLDLTTRQTLVKKLMRAGERRMSAEEINELAMKSGAQNPLWLGLAYRLLTEYGGDVLLTKIAELPDTLIDLFEVSLRDLESVQNGDLLIAILSSLTVSKYGLSKHELRRVLKPDALKPPSPYFEKQDSETSEKSSQRTQSCCGHITDSEWHEAFSDLKHFLRPYSKKEKLNLSNSELRKAIRRRYFRMDVEDGTEDEGRSCKQFWHGKLADYFQLHGSVQRKTEELLYQLQHLDDERIVASLTDWELFDRFYSDIQPRKLLNYWKHQTACLVTAYTIRLRTLEADEASSQDLIALRYGQVARVFLCAGFYDEALELAKSEVKIETQELGSRPERLADLYGLMSEIYDEKLKLHDFVSSRQLPDLRRTISYGRRSIELREKLDGDENRLKFGLSLMKLAFCLDNWEACGADAEMTGAQAISEGNRHINRALKIFTEMNDIGHKAEAMMTKGVLAQRGSTQQLKYYHQAMEICQQLYGEHHVLVSRLYINIGIVYEDKKNYLRAYRYFKKWARVTEEVLGPNHPKTLRARNVLNEERYRYIAETLERVADNSGNNALPVNARSPDGEEEVPLWNDDDDDDDDEDDDDEDDDDDDDDEEEDEDDDFDPADDISSRLVAMELDQ